REVLDDLLGHAREIARRAKEMTPAELDYAEQRLEWLADEVWRGAAGEGPPAWAPQKVPSAGLDRGLDTRWRGPQGSNPSIRLRKRYPPTRDGGALPTPLTNEPPTPDS